MMSPGFETIPGSGRGERELVEIVRYDPVWPARFMEWRGRLAGALQPLRSHGSSTWGSTAVPGLAQSR